MSDVASLGNLGDIGKRIVSGTILEIVTLENIDEISEKLAKCVGITETYKSVIGELTGQQNRKIQYFREALYHGVLHAQLVFIAAMEGIYHQAIPYDEDIKNLAIAALMHDFSHISMHTGDDDNIYVATKGVNSSTVKDKHRVSIPTIRTLIRATRFPWKNNHPKPLAKVLRDADLMFVYVKDPALKLALIKGLYCEMSGGSLYDEASEERLIEFHDKQAKFHTTFSWNSRWGAMKAVKYNYPKLLAR